MSESSHFVLLLGALFLAALALDAVGRATHVPRVTLLIGLGAAVGPPGLDILPTPFISGRETYTAVALTMVAFLLGGSLDRRTLAEHGREILALSLCIVTVSVALVAAALLALGMPLVPALALAGISAATAPAATRDVVRQSGRRGRFATNLLGIVAIDDAWGLIAFTAMLMLAGALTGGAGSGAVLYGLHEAGGGALLGLAVGLPAAALTGRLKRGEPSLLEALGVVLVTAGAALALEVSYLLAGMVAGATVVNLARHHRYPFHEIERIEWPFVLLFFVMAGAALETGMLAAFGVAGLAYVAARVAARVIGGWCGAQLAGLSPREGLLTGLALTPQAGVAIGMALVAADRHPEHAERIMAVTLASTVIFEIAGPLLAQVALRRAVDLPETSAPHPDATLDAGQSSATGPR